MSVKVFLELVEIKAKTASVLPFILGLFLAAYHYHTVQPMLALLFFIAMFLTTTTITFTPSTPRTISKTPTSSGAKTYLRT